MDYLCLPVYMLLTAARQDPPLYPLTITPPPSPLVASDAPPISANSS
jgi:hypothetical protein